MNVTSTKRALGWTKYVVKRVVRAHLSPKVEPMDGARGNAIVRHALCGGSPFLAGRVGSTELRSYLHVNGFAYDPKVAKQLERLSGIYPPSWQNLKLFARLLEDSIREVDALAVFGWNNEDKVVELLHDGAHVVPPKTLEPYFYPGEGWWHELGGKRLLIVNSIASELRARFTVDTLNRLWPHENGKVNSIIPSEIHIIDAPYGWDATQQHRFATFQYLLDNIKLQVEKIDFDIALVACGGYGLPLAAWIKQRGKQAIHLGGVIQVWGGFKGARFETLVPWKHIINEHWIPYPDKKIPTDRSHAEGDYWQRA